MDTEEPRHRDTEIDRKRTERDREIEIYVL